MSGESFSVGEVAILVPCAPYDPQAEKYLGQEIEIVAPLELVLHMDDPAYQFKASDGVIGWATPKALRKRRPPPTREQTSTWDDLIVWRPKEIAHV